MLRFASFPRNLVFVLVLVSVWLSPGILSAHCDTFAGPVLLEAQKAMKTGDVTPLLKWVKPEREGVIEKAFVEALKNREVDREKADNAFFEILIRIHREGEGAPFTGIKPLGTELPAAITAADKALETGSSEELIDLLARDLVRKVRASYQRALEKKRSAEKSVALGREYVAAYVEYVHFVEALSGIRAGGDGHQQKCGEAKTGSDSCSSCDFHGK